VPVLLFNISNKSGLGNTQKQEMFYV